MLYDLAHPFEYKENADTGKKSKCKGIDFRRPKGREAKAVFMLLAAIKPIAEDGAGEPVDAADAVINFVTQYGHVVGDKDFPMETVAENLDAADVMALSGHILENFT